METRTIIKLMCLTPMVLIGVWFLCGTQSVESVYTTVTPLGDIKRGQFVGYEVTWGLPLYDEGYITTFIIPSSVIETLTCILMVSILPFACFIIILSKYNKCLRFWLCCECEDSQQPRQPRARPIVLRNLKRSRAGA